MKDIFTRPGRKKQKVDVADLEMLEAKVASSKFSELYDSDGNLLWKKGRKSILTYHEAKEIATSKVKAIVKDEKSYKGPFRTASVNPYLNTPPTKLNKDLKNEKDPEKRKQMREALNAWRTTVPGPFLKSAEELLKIAKELMR